MVSNSIFEEKEFILQSGDFRLPGIFTFPKGITQYPIVVFIHGSGPNDRDETIGPNKPFRDLAHGLARYNIASFRYDKRTFVYGAKSKVDGQNINLRQEVLDDAESAIRFSSEQNGVDKIFVLGHSLGGMLAPKIAGENTEVDGIIIMAGNARPLEHLILEQYNYLLSQDGLSESDHNILDELQVQVDNLEGLHENANDTSNNLPLGLTATYWRSLMEYDQVEEIQSIGQKILVLQGERDYQVTMEDFRLWQAALKENDKAIFKSYPKLNHLFLEGEGPSYPKEYQVEGSIPDYVIQDISDWILGNN